MNSDITLQEKFEQAEKNLCKVTDTIVTAYTELRELADSVARAKKFAEEFFAKYPKAVDNDNR